MDPACDDIDDADDTEPSCPSANHDHRVNVLKGIVKALRLENTTLQQTLVGERHTAKANTEIVATQRMAKEREGVREDEVVVRASVRGQHAGARPADHRAAVGTPTARPVHQAVDLSRAARPVRGSCTEGGAARGTRAAAEVYARGRGAAQRRAPSATWRSERSGSAWRREAEESQRELQRVGEELERYKRRAADAKTEASQPHGKAGRREQRRSQRAGRARANVWTTLCDSTPCTPSRRKRRLRRWKNLDAPCDVERRAAVEESARSMLQINELKDASRTQMHVAQANELKSARAGRARAMGRAHTFRSWPRGVRGARLRACAAT